MSPCRVIPWPVAPQQSRPPFGPAALKVRCPMERIKGRITIRDILLDHDNWQRFVEAHGGHIRPAVYENIRRMLACRTPELGFHVYACPACGEQRIVPHSCKSRLCSSCGKPATDRFRRGGAQRDARRGIPPPGLERALAVAHADVGQPQAHVEHPVSVGGRRHHGLVQALSRFHARADRRDAHVRGRPEVPSARARAGHRRRAQQRWATVGAAWRRLLDARGGPEEAVAVSGLPSATSAGTRVGR